MDAAGEQGLFRAWYDAFKNFDTRTTTRTRRRGGTPHLGTGALLVTALVSSYFVAYLADTLAIIAAYGPNAYFREGLHVVDWKHNLLSNGAFLSFTGALIKILTTLMLWAVAILATDFGSMLIQRTTQRKGRWLGMVLRLIGGAALLAFAAFLYRQGGWGLHPIPLSALTGGAALIWRGFTFLSRKSIEITN
jgi:hypothetical protein